MQESLPFLDVTASGFSTRSDAVLRARSAAWCARTPFGLAVLRHAQAGRILRDRRFRQGSHDWPRKVGLEGAFAEFWMRSIISMEGEPHKLQRRAAQAALAEPYVLSLVPEFEAIARDLIVDWPDRFDFIDAFSEPFAGHAIARLLGLPPEDAAQLARDASTLGLAMGVDAKHHESAVNAATDRLIALADELIDHGTRQTFVPRLVGAARDLGITDRQILRDLIVISIFGGVDTTRAQLAFAVALFIDAPHHWARLRREPQGVSNALDEIIRQRPTTTWATRQAVEAVDIDGVKIAPGTTLHVMVHATGLDPATGGAPDFDPFKRRKVHFGFGGGAHHCLGQFVARTDMACALRVLLANVTRFEWAGTPDYLPDSGNTSPRRLPVTAMRA